MLIEHSFVTTLEPKEALQTAAALLGRGGFVAEPQNFTVGNPAWQSLQMRRGRTSARRAKDPTQCPQQVRLDCDRGRVSFAGTIEPMVNRSFFGSLAISSGSKLTRSTQEFADLMIIIARGIESALVSGVPVEQATDDWARLEADLQARARRRRLRKARILVAVFVLVIGGTIAAGMLMPLHH